MNMIEEWGSGIPKLMREMKEYGLREPEFIDLEIGFRVNLYRNQDLATSQETDQEKDKTDQETNQKPSDTGQEISQKKESATVLTNTDKIRKAITENPSVTQKSSRNLPVYPEAECVTFCSRCGIRESWKGLGRRKKVSGF